MQHFAAMWALRAVTGAEKRKQKRQVGEERACAARVEESVSREEDGDSRKIPMARGGTDVDGGVGRDVGYER